LTELSVRLRRVEHEPGVQSARSDGLELMQAWQRVQLQLGVVIVLSKQAERVRDHASPGCILGESDPQRSRLAARHTLGALGRLVQLLKNSPRLIKEQSTGRTDLHTATEPIEQLETDLTFEVLNLSRERRLRHAQALRSPAEVLFFADGDEVSEMAQFHFDTLPRLV
jgi:hypothetical protein